MSARYLAGAAEALKAAITPSQRKDGLTYMAQIAELEEERRKLAEKGIDPRMITPFVFEELKILKGTP